MEKDNRQSSVDAGEVGFAAERLLVEMRDKLKNWMSEFEGVQTPVGGESLAPVVNIVADAEDALISLGYKPQDASRMVTAVNDDSVEDSEELIRRALKSMVKA